MDEQMSFGKLILNSPIIGDVAKKVASLKVNHDAGNIAEHFTQFLKPQYASTDVLRDEVFKIRHNVYCEELAFENQKDDGMEMDEFDPHSIFALIKHKPTNNYTSCVRIVRTLRDFKTQIMAFWEPLMTVFKQRLISRPFGRERAC